MPRCCCCGCGGGGGGPPELFGRRANCPVRKGRTERGGGDGGGTGAVEYVVDPERCERAADADRDLDPQAGGTGCRSPSNPLYMRMRCSSGCQAASGLIEFRNRGSGPRVPAHGVGRRSPAVQLLAAHSRPVRSGSSSSCRCSEISRSEWQSRPCLHFSGTAGMQKSASHRAISLSMRSERRLLGGLLPSTLLR